MSPSLSAPTSPESGIAAQTPAAMPRSRRSAPQPPEKLLRGHAADAVFERLARGILRGEYKVGSSMPPERILAENFQLSRVIARQAVHRLAEVGLVAVRQGGKTIVQDPANAADLRVMELMMRLGPSSANDVRELGERQILYGHSLLFLAQARATAMERSAIATVVAAYARVGGTDAELPVFEERFWTSVAEATQNRLYRLELRWWYRRLATQPKNRHPIYGSADLRLAFYGEIARRLVEREDAAAYYLEISSMVLKQLSAAARPGEKPPPKPGPRRRTKKPSPTKRSPK